MKRASTIDKNLKSKMKKNKTKSRKSGSSKKQNKLLTKFKVFLIWVLSLCTLSCYAGLFLLYGPYEGFRDWLITTAMCTMSHQYLATWFYDTEAINYSLARNNVEDTNASTDTDLIEIVDYTKTKEDITYENEYERQILEKKAKNNDYKIIPIKGGKYSGYLAAIYDPSRVKVVASKYLGKDGQYLTTLSKEHKAFVGINAGGFVDEAYNGTGGTPSGMVISKGKFLWNANYQGKGGLIGLDKSDKLILGKYSTSQAKTLGIRDGVCFGPFLIVNGEKTVVTGNGGWGTGPRSVIGQRKDGIILLLVVDGDRTLGRGATLKDIQDIMVNYGAYNAANLDGGTSASMTVNGETINDPTNLSGKHRTRPIASAFILEADKSDDGEFEK